MRAPIKGRQRAPVILGALALVGCTTWRVQSVLPADVLVRESKPGKVRIERADASRVVLTQPTVEGDSIRGPQGAVAISEIRTIAVRRFHFGRTLGLVGGILAAGAIGCLASKCLDYEIGNIYAVRVKELHP